MVSAVIDSARPAAPPTPRGRLGAAVAALSVLGALLAQLPAAAPAAAATATVAPKFLALATYPAPASYPVPASGSFAVAGHGAGHGHGLSQYGAQGAGLHGVALAPLLSHYYPGTALGSLPDSPLRVLLTATVAPAGVLVVSPAVGLTATNTASGRRAVLPAGPVLWRAVRTADGRSHLQALAGATAAWTESTLLGGAGAGPLAFSSAGTVRLWPAARTQTDVRALPSRAYRGRLELRPTPTGTAVLDVLPMESYLRAVVPRESSSSWPDVTLQAQAVAARSYAANKRAAYATSRYFDVYDSTADQVFGGTTAYTAAGTATALEVASTDRAIAATAAKALLYAGRPAFTQFSSSDGGWSADGGAPYLTASADPWERAYSTNPYKDWGASIGAARLEDAAGRPHGWLTRLTVTSRDGHGDWGGRVLLVRLDHVGPDGSVASVVLSGSAVQRAGGLHSTYFTVTSPALGSPPAVMRSLFVPLTPARALDTRRGGGPLTTSPRSFTLTGMAGVPRTGATAVVLQATVVAPTAAIRFTMWPSGDARPAVPTLFTVAGQDRAGHAEVRLGAGGGVSVVLDAGRAQLVLDVVGYLTTAPTPGASRLVVPVARRLLDTRTSRTPLGPGESRGLLVRGPNGAPAQASAVVVNLTAVGASAVTYLSATAAAGRPTVSALAEPALGTVANTVVVPVAKDGRVWLFNNAGRTHLIVDLLGWYVPPTSPAQGRTATSRLTPLLDTRTTPGGPLLGGTRRTVGVTGPGLLPAGSTAALVVLCSVGPTGSVVLTAAAGGAAMPPVSHVNATRGRPACNTVWVPLSRAGTLTVGEGGAATDVTVALAATLS